MRARAPVQTHARARTRATDHFIRATELLAESPTAYGGARAHYLAALENITQAPAAPPAAARARARGQSQAQARAQPQPPQLPQLPQLAARAPAQPQPAAPAQAAAAARPQLPQPPAQAAFIVDAAFGFAIGGLAELFANDPALGEAIATELFIGAVAEQMRAGDAFEAFIDQPLAAAATRGRAAVIADRREIARAAPAATAAYVEAATAHTDDPQNSHDTGVLASLRAVVDRLRADGGDQQLVTLDDVAADIRQNGPALSDGRPALVADALAVVERMRRLERVLAIGASDEECLRLVWQRADDKRNRPVRDKIRRAVFDALVDSWEPGVGPGAVRHIVCVNGRTTRVLAALVLLDWDERNWDVKSLEQFKNDVFAASAAVIAETAAVAARDPDGEMRAAAAAWLAKTPAELAAAAASDEASEALAARMRAAVSDLVSEMVSRHGLENRLPAPVIEAVRSEALAAVM
jgi:hypothetical protein